MDAFARLKVPLVKLLVYKQMDSDFVWVFCAPLNLPILGDFERVPPKRCRPRSMPPAWNANRRLCLHR